MSEDATLDEFIEDANEGEVSQTRDSDELDQEQFGPFTLSTPGEWTAKRLGKIKRLITRGKQPTYADEGVPVINQECIYWDGWHFENLRYLDEDVADGWKEKYFPNSGDVILNSTGQGTLGRAQVYPDEKRRAIDSHVTLLRTDDELNPYFHRYFLESYLGQALLYSMCVNGSTGQIELSKTRLDLLPVPLPPLKEQRKIATVLHNVDQAIQKTEQVVDQAERVKKGVIQENVLDRVSKASSPTELGEVPDNWETVKLEDVASEQEDSLVDGPFGSSLKAEEFVEDGFARILQLQNVKEGWYSDSNVRYVDRQTYDGLERHSAKPGDVFIAKMASPVARACILPDEYDHYMLGCADVVKLVPNEDFVDEFVVYCLNSYPVWKQAAAHIRGSGRLRVNLNQLKEVELPKPPRGEQEKIVSAVNSMTDYIESYKNENEQLQRLKQGLMQDLLSGTVRTTDTNIEVPDEIAQHG
jgi:type I restriction enzyme S subunit